MSLGFLSSRQVQKMLSMWSRLSWLWLERLRKSNVSNHQVYQSLFYTMVIYLLYSYVLYIIDQTSFFFCIGFCSLGSLISIIMLLVFCLLIYHQKNLFVNRYVRIYRIGKQPSGDKSSTSTVQIKGQPIEQKNNCCG